MKSPLSQPPGVIAVILALLGWTSGSTQFERASTLTPPMIRWSPAKGR